MDILSLIAGGGALLGGLLGQNKNRLSKEFFDIQGNAKALARSNELYNPNSSVYRQAGRGFYNRLNSTIPSTGSLLQQLSAQGINSPTIANIQREAALRRAGQQAANYESDLFGNMQGLAANYLQQYYGNQQYSKSAYANQYNQDNPYPSLMNFGAGILGYQLGQGSNNSNNSNNEKWRDITGTWEDENYWNNLLGGGNG